MGIPDLMKDKRFNIFFSFVLGIGLICIFRPMCTGSECNVSRAPTDKDFDKYVYRMGEGKCYEFKSEIIECPVSGTIEAFRECNFKEKRDTSVSIKHLVSFTHTTSTALCI